MAKKPKPRPWQDAYMDEREADRVRRCPKSQTQDVYWDGAVTPDPNTKVVHRPRR